jgi:hypothetical protein
MDRLMDALFELTSQVRYVAVYRHGELSLRQRLGLSTASAPVDDAFDGKAVSPCPIPFRPFLSAVR